MPACGVTPASVAGGVPSSASGIAVLANLCGDARLLDTITVRDASGQAIPFSVEQLPNGQALITPEGGLMPGSYTVAVMSELDADGGFDPMTVEQTVDVQESAPLPEVFGTIEREAGSCSSVLELTPDPETVPYLALISVDIQIDDGPIVPFIVTGTMKLVNGVASVAIPDDMLDYLAYGEHQVRITVHIAGESEPLDMFMMTLNVPCSDSYEDDTGKLCSVSRVGSASFGASAACAALALGIFALRKRRRRAR